jgi:hypothetical protein
MIEVLGSDKKLLEKTSSKYVKCLYPGAGIYTQEDPYRSTRIKLTLDKCWVEMPSPK